MMMMVMRVKGWKARKKTKISEEKPDDEKMVPEEKTGDEKHKQKSRGKGVWGCEG